VLLTALLAGCSRAAAQLAAADPAAHLPRGVTDLEPYLKAVIADCKIPGMTAVVLRGDRIVAQGAAGVRKSGSPEAVTLGDAFHLGSNTKSMTATLAGLLVDEGKLKWTDTLGELWGDDAPKMDPAWRPVTLLQVLGHRGGFSHDNAAFRRDRKTTDPRALMKLRRELIGELLAKAPDYPPGSKMVYSNTGFILLGAVVEKITGRPWEELMRERLFKPLAINSAGFGPPGTVGKLDAPWGHGPLGLANQRDNPAVIGPAGTVHMAIGDWAKYVTLHLRGDPRNPHREVKLLKPETFERLHTPASGESYIAGWVCEQRPAFKGAAAGSDGKVIWHNGSNTSWYAVMVLAPEVDYAVLLAINCHNAEAVKACDIGSRALLRFYLENDGKTSQSEAPAK
jgi:CubicO group peptidase (beta-lactamase class C family)